MQQSRELYILAFGSGNYLEFEALTLFPVLTHFKVYYNPINNFRVVRESASLDGLYFIFEVCAATFFLIQVELLTQE